MNLIDKFQDVHHGSTSATASPNETANADPARAQKKLADSKLPTLLSLPTTRATAHDRRRLLRHHRRHRQQISSI
jgi:hypothetical protein